MRNVFIKNYQLICTSSYLPIFFEETGNGRFGEKEKKERIYSKQGIQKIYEKATSHIPFDFVVVPAAVADVPGDVADGVAEDAAAAAWPLLCED